MTSVLTLFAVAFLSGSLLPLQSEVLFAALLKAGDVPALFLLAAASTGNTAGAALNWWLGIHIARFRHKKWFPVKEPALRKAELRFARWGKWSLLLSWVPLIGDPITVIAGVLRMNFVQFLGIVAFAKTMRYAAIGWALL